MDNRQKLVIPYWIKLELFWFNEIENNQISMYKYTLQKQRQIRILYVKRLIYPSAVLVFNKIIKVYFRVCKNILIDTRM